MKDSACHARGLVEQHFGRRLRPTDERTLREHLPGCAPCRSYYERHLLLQRLDPKASASQERLGQALGLVRPPFPTARAGAALAAGVMLAALGGMVARPMLAEDTGGFTARGGPTLTAAEPLRAYRIRAGAEPQPVEGELRTGDELAFAYQNPRGRKWLLIYGVDEHRNVYWFHPSWSHPEDNPPAVPAQAGPGLHELPEAISHDFAGKQLTLHGLLADERLTVRQAEALLKGRDPDEPLPLRGAVHSSLSVKVRP
jgi:hypothetical protein